MFAGNEKVSFGDINLSEEPIRGNHSPGAGGWPTIRYFNEETGIEGGTYQKVTDDAMCTELGDMDHMVAYVEGYGNTSLCSVTDGAGCDEKELAYIEKMKVKSVEDIANQLTRLISMEGESMKPDLKMWVKKRRKIMEQLSAAKKDEL
mmetsp:Transcript_3532/g.6118  ORF Transcript_3532/g.6118 Transcript_3532/m.6118 type:complete len:148 (-) Transcript_3532:305-748(-)